MPTEPSKLAGAPRRALPAGAWFVLVGLVTFGVYAPSIGSDFVDWDDTYNFLTNESYRGLGPANLRWMFTAFHQGHFHPLAWVTLGIDYSIWGMNPHGYHLTNVLLHAINAGLFAWVVSLLCLEGGARRGAPLATGVACGLLWSLHPLRVEAVSWITQRREVLCGACTLLAIAGHLRGKPAWRTAVLSALAMLSKATAVTIPVLFVLIDIHRFGGIGAPGWPRAALRSLRRHAHLVVMAAAVSLLAVAAQREAEAMIAAEDLSITSRLALYFYGAFFYVLKTVVPAGLAPLHAGQVGATWSFQPYVWRQAGAGLVLVAAALTAGWAMRRRRPAWILFVVAYLVMLLPVGGLGQSGRQIVAERYAYQIGWVLTLAAALPIAAKARTRDGLRKPIVIAAAAGIVLLAIGCVVQQRCWADTGALWRCELAAHPDDPVGNANLGAWYQRQGDFPKAEEFLRKSIAAAPDYLTPHLKLAEVLQQERRPEEAVAIYASLIEMNPRNSVALSKIAPLHWAAGRRSEALGALARWEEAEPRNVDAILQHARALAAAGLPKEAIADLERGIEVTGSAAVWGELAWILATNPDPQVRNGKRALELAERAASIRPRPIRLVLVLAASAAEAKEWDRGIREVEASIAEVPSEHAQALRRVVSDLRAHTAIRVAPSYP